MSNRKKGKKKKLSIKKLIIGLVVLFSIILFLYKICTIHITNIYIKGNMILSDQEIIDIAGISNYPNSIKNNFYVIEKRLSKNKYILSVHVHKSFLLNKVYIEIIENYPLFYYTYSDKTILFNGKSTTDTFIVPTVINQIPDTIYDKFLKEIKDLDKEVLYRISEINYSPNDVDQKRFLLIMNDGNYVYITTNTFKLLNKYFEMIESFDNKKGILHLDSGEYFEIFTDDNKAI